MKIAVLGTVMRDEIHTFRGERRESFGGILYNVLALAALTDPERDEIRPVCYLGAEHKAAITEEFFAHRPHIRTQFMRECTAGTDQNVLQYRTASDRAERMTLVTPPLDLAADLLPACADADAIILNVINAREVDLTTLAALRRACPRAHIHLDIHNLGKGLDAESRLVPKGLPDWRDWLSQVNTVQGNEWEMELLLGNKPESEEELTASAQALAAIPAIEAAVLTVGGRGAIVAHRLTPGGGLALLRVRAMDLEAEALDTTGCGDCFSSAFVLEMLRTRNPARAALLATTLSGLNTLSRGLEAFEKNLDLPHASRQAFPALMQSIENGWLGEPTKE
ncbi:MAG: carbohydrate kinase family protein [Sumerlaeia bacterium]